MRRWPPATCCSTFWNRSASASTSIRARAGSRSSATARASPSISRLYAYASERAPESVAGALGIMPSALWAAEGERGMAVLHDASQVRDLRPNLEAIATLPFSALVVTAPGFAGDCDFVSRYFAPKYGVGEDFVTGSAHCVLTPYWAGVIEKSKLFARQLSARGGELWVEARGDRVRIGGTCVLILEGQLKVQP